MTSRGELNRSEEAKLADSEMDAAINAYIYGPMPRAPGQPSPEEMMRLTLENDPGDLPEDTDL